MEKIKILGKEYDVKFPDQETTAKEFGHWLELHEPDNDEWDFFEMFDFFNAYLFMKYNKDLFVKMMVEEANKTFWRGIHNWFEREIPI